MLFARSTGAATTHATADWGKTETQYPRVARTNYADGSPAVGRADARGTSATASSTNGQNLFSENGVTQWGCTWGQFLDHTFGLRDRRRPRARRSRSTHRDPLEEFPNDVGTIDFARTPAAPGTGARPAPADQHRQQLHRRLGVYGGDRRRLEWLRTGPVDGNMANNGDLMLTGRLSAARRRARQRLDRAADGPDGRAGRAPPTRGRRGRRAGEREHRADRGADAVRARAQPDRRRCCRRLCPGAEVRDRAAGRRRGRAVHHVQRVPSGAGRTHCRRTAATTPT